MVMYYTHMTRAALGRKACTPVSSLFVVVSSLVCVLVCCICGLLSFHFTNMGRRNVKCHLCRLPVDGADWQNGGHRKGCSIRNEHFLKNLPEPFDIRCPTCLKYLKLMPKNCGRTFTCDERDCPFPGEIHNNGHNRLSCYTCDYDLCDSCVHRRLFVLTKFVKRNSSIFNKNPPCDVYTLEVDCHPIPTMAANHCYLNDSFSISDPPSYREEPGLTSLGIPVPNEQPPYLLSTYV